MSDIEDKIREAIFRYTAMGVSREQIFAATRTIMAIVNPLVEENERLQKDADKYLGKAVHSMERVLEVKQINEQLQARVSELNALNAEQEAFVSQLEMERDDAQRRRLEACNRKEDELRVIADYLESIQKTSLKDTEGLLNYQTDENDSKKGGAELAGTFPDDSHD